MGLVTLNWQQDPHEDASDCRLEGTHVGAVAVISRRTLGILAGGVLVSAVGMLLIRAGVGGSETADAVVANMGSVITGASAAAVSLWAALRFERGELLRTEWLLIGAGMLALLAGDVIFAYLEVTAGSPFPSSADVFYLLSFPLLGSAVLMALLGFRKSMRLAPSIAWAGGITVVVTAVAWIPVLQPILADTESPPLLRFLAVLYPVGDFWLLLFPALALAIALARFAGGRLAWPWWATVVGFSLVAAADTVFAVLVSADAYSTGSAVDLGWSLGYTAIAVAASLLVDVQRPIDAGGRP